jgi:NADH:ubiquinone reductase (H+-translocating)
VTTTADVVGADQHAIPLKSVTDALRLRNSLLGAFEAAAAHGARAEVGATRLVIVGGGASGVEVAGYSADFLIPSFAHDYPQLAAPRCRSPCSSSATGSSPACIPL